MTPPRKSVSTPAACAGKRSTRRRLVIRASSGSPRRSKRFR